MIFRKLLQSNSLAIWIYEVLMKSSCKKYGLFFRDFRKKYKYCHFERGILHVMKVSPSS